MDFRLREVSISVSGLRVPWVMTNPLRLITTQVLSLLDLEVILIVKLVL
jgi:hypothetical protein